MECCHLVENVKRAAVLAKDSLQNASCSGKHRWKLYCGLTPAFNHQSVELFCNFL
jgi:hypothetical protein